MSAVFMFFINKQDKIIVIKFRIDKNTPKIIRAFKDILGLACSSKYSSSEIIWESSTTKVRSLLHFSHFVMFIPLLTCLHLGQVLYSIGSDDANF